MEQQSYPSDLSEEQWALLEPLLPAAKPGGRPRTVNLCAVINAILQLLRSGWAWRRLPHDFPPWGTVYTYFRNWRKDGTWERIHEALRPQVRQAEGHEPTPSAGIIDSQSSKTTEQGGERGYDAGKKVNGRKRHIIVDTLGLLLAVVVHSARIQHRDGAKLVLAQWSGRFPRLQLLWADGGHAGPVVEWVLTFGGWVLEIVKRPEGAQGLQVLPRRWVVERTLAWLGRYRRLSKDYEAWPQTREAFLDMAMIHLMLRRLGPA